MTQPGFSEKSRRGGEKMSIIWFRPGRTEREVWIDGGRTATGVDAIEWAKRVDGFGVETILPTSKSTDGAKTGYDLPLIRQMRAATSAAIVASGGAGTLEHFLEAVQAGATILLAASVFHFKIIGIQELKAFLKARLSR